MPTHAAVITAVNNFITDHTNPGLHCYDAIHGVNSAGDEVWTIFLGKTLPQDDSLRLDIAEHLSEQLDIGSDVVMEW